MSVLLPAYLLGLLGLGLPWLLHRFSHQNPPQEVFPSTRFLEATKPPVSRKKQLRHRVLFALRLLFLAGLCLLFAEPWLRTARLAGAGEQVHLIALDRSFSMRAAERWDSALNEARNVIDAVPTGSTLQLLTFDGQVNAIAEPAVDKAIVLAALSGVKPGYAATDYGNVMQRLNTLAAEFDKPVAVTLITDAQASSLPAQLNSLVASRVHSLSVRAIGKPNVQNFRLSAQARTSDGVHARVAVAVGASNSGETDEEFSRELIVEHENRVLARESITLRSGDAKSIVLEQIPLPATEDTDLHIAFVGNDDLVDDDAAHVVVRGAEPLGVAIASLAVKPSAQANVFMRTALQTDGEAQVLSVPSGNRKLPLDALHAVVFADMATSRVPPEVQSFVDNGGNALVVHTPNRRQSATSASQNPAGDITSPVTVGRVDDAHPLGLGDIDWLPVNIYTLPAIEPSADDRVLVETTDRQAVLIERPSENGTLLLLSDPLDGDASDLPLQPAFVALIQQTLRYFDASSALPETVTAGHSISLPANVQLLSPSGDALLELAETGVEQNVTLDTPGVYTVIGNQGGHRLTVLIDPQESDLRTLPETELRAWEQKHGVDTAAENAVQTGGVTEPSVNTSAVLDAANRLPLWRYLLPFAVVLLFLESVFANRRLSVRRDGS